MNGCQYKCQLVPTILGLELWAHALSLSGSLISSSAAMERRVSARNSISLYLDGKFAEIQSRLSNYRNILLCICVLYLKAIENKEGDMGPTAS